MKIASIIFSVISIGLIIFNCTKINFNDPLSKDSSAALIGVVSGFIVLVILLIFYFSKKIEQKSKS